MLNSNPEQIVYNKMNKATSQTISFYFPAKNINMEYYNTLDNIGIKITYKIADFPIYIFS